ncbi:MAG: type II toxin-antitoxin system RelE/ParE family toxin [Balneolia bacterium]|nr:type II toxin-antitoxin system RelE/ParE family toxin [Balneolia bacterium]
MAFRIVVDPRAIDDIQQAIAFLDEKQPGLGKRFDAELNKFVLRLGKNPFFRIRYDSVRCLPLQKFPYMIHFTVDETKKLVTIQAIFHTSRDPENLKKRS